MIFSENRYPSRIKSGAGFFGIMLKASSQVAATRRPSRALRGAPVFFATLPTLSGQKESEREHADQRGKAQAMAQRAARPEGAAGAPLADDVGLVLVGRCEQAGER
jgi:hypothetical protein